MNAAADGRGAPHSTPEAQMKTRSEYPARLRRLLCLLFGATIIADCADSRPAMSAPARIARDEIATAAMAPLTQSDGVPVMTGLANPRGLAWGPEGALYVAEAGRGGPGPCFIVLGSTVCYGATGGVSRLWHGQQERLVSDLPSWVITSNKSGQAEGPNGISFNGLGNAYVSVGLEADPAKRNAAPELGGFGRIVQLSPSALSPGRGDGRGAARWEFVADLGQYESDVNPDCGDRDSNPYGVLAVPGGVIVPDAGANALVRMDANGTLSTLAAFSNNTTVPGEGCPPAATRDFVPTSIVVGPDGAYYIGHLNGLAILPGSSNIWRLEPGGTPTPYCTGFTWIIGLAFDPNGNVYVLQFSDGPVTTSGGSLVRVAPDCTRSTVVTGLKNPTGVAVDDDGNVYVSLINGPNFAAEGQVRRFRP
jgi:hypothetical protein